MTAIELRMLFVVGLILMTVASVAAAAALGGLVRAIDGARAGRRLRRRGARIEHGEGKVKAWT